MNTWNYQIEPIRREEIPKRIYEYFMMHTFNLTEQHWRDGLRFIAGYCDECGNVLGYPVAKARDIFRLMDCNPKDVFRVICKRCYDEETKREIEAGLLKVV